MPTYEYSCQNCQDVFEVFQSMRDAPLTTCPKCGQATVKRLIGRGAGIIFKGSGFYETDYKRPPAKSEGTESSGGGATTTPPATTGGATTAPASAGTPATTATAAPAKKD
jgi:putative FmdB family regulatory protein